MSKEDALKIVTNACAGFHGNLADHQTIQKALDILKEHIIPGPPKE